MTIWNHTNSGPRAKVADVEERALILDVVEIDDQQGVVTTFQRPLCIQGTSVVTNAHQYRAIHPIYGGEKRPILFLCFGRIE